MENKDLLNSLFDSARAQAPEASFAETKASFLKATKATGNGKLKNLTLKKGLLMTFSISLIGAIVWFAISPNKSVPDANIKLIAVPESKAATVAINEQSITITPMTPTSISPPAPIEVSISELKAVYKTHANYALAAPTKSAPSQDRTTPGTSVTLDTAYRFPVLTLKQIEENKKHKKKMLKNFLKAKKGSCSLIPSGSFKAHDKQVSVQSFYMQRKEVSVLEYRTFLFDLLIQGRKEDFLAAKPDQTLWTHQDGEYRKGMQPMEDHYFSHAAYNEYPINNISRAGAELYCKWLTEEIRKQYPDKLANADIRMPTQFEWLYAAKGGLKHAVYPWGGPYARNAKGCYLANFWPTPESENVNLENVSCFAVDNEDYEVHVVGANLDSTLSIASDGGLFTVNVGSYIPNNYGLYNMSGNVAEMVNYPQKQQIGALGGGWLSNIEHIKIESEDPYLNENGPHLNIGFRVVYTNTSGQ